MEVDLVKIIDYIFGSFCSSLTIYVIGCSIIGEKFQIKRPKIIMYLILMSILFVVNYFLLNNPYRIINSYLIISIYYKIVFKEEFRKSMILGFVMMVLLTFGEIVFSFFLVAFIYIFKDSDKSIFLANSVVNIIIGSISIIIYNLCKKRIKAIIHKYTNRVKIYLIFTSILILLVIGILFVNLFNNYWDINKYLYIDILIILALITISATLLFQEYSKINLQDKYELMNNYMKKNADLIEKYSSIQHSHKNQLILIKGYIENKDKKIITYINDLLKDYKIKKYEWITNVNRINLNSIRYLIFYKLSEAEDHNLKLSVQISEELKNIDFESLEIREIRSLSIIIGEYLDNAIYASNFSKKKELYFDCYLENETMIIEITNSYKGHINLNEISKKGFSTKGQNRGIGVYDIDRIVSRSKTIDTKRTIKSNYFIAKVIIDLKK